MSGCSHPLLVVFCISSIFVRMKLLLCCLFVNYPVSTGDISARPPQQVLHKWSIKWVSCHYIHNLHFPPSGPSPHSHKHSGFINFPYLTSAIASEAGFVFNMNKISHFLFLFHFSPRKLHPDGWTPKSLWSSQQYVAPLCPWVNISTRGTVLLLFLFDSKFFSKMCDILKYGLSGQVVKMKTVPLLRLKYNAVTLHGERLPASRLVRAMNLSKHCISAP